MATPLEKLSRIMNERAKAAVVSLADEVLASSEEFVPYRTGRLMRSGHVEEKSSSHSAVVYSASYASECYYATHPFSKKKHPKATARWFEAAKSAYLDRWKRLVRDELTRPSSQK